MSAVQDDLLCATLELLLSSPPVLLPLKHLAIPIRLALRLGLQFPQVAEVTVDALESWEKHDLENLKSVMPIVLPLLEPYLRDSKAKNGQDSGKHEGKWIGGKYRKNKVIGHSPVEVSCINLPCKL